MSKKFEVIIFYKDKSVIVHAKNGREAKRKAYNRVSKRKVVIDKKNTEIIDWS